MRRSTRPDADRRTEERIFPEEHARSAMGITGLTLPTMYRWVTSSRGRAATMHPYMKGHYLGSGPAEMVLLEAGLDGKSLVCEFAIDDPRAHLHRFSQHWPQRHFAV
jgi:hypothetical protein